MKTDNLTPWRGIISGVLASAFFAIAYVDAGMSVGESVLVGALVLIGLTLVLGFDGDVDEAYTGISGFDPLKAIETIEDARGNLLKLKTVARAYPSSIGPKIDAYRDAAQNVVLALERAPKRLTAARRFVETHDAITVAVVKFSDLEADQSELQANLIETLERGTALAQQQFANFTSTAKYDLGDDLAMLRMRISADLKH